MRTPLSLLFAAVIGLTTATGCTLQPQVASCVDNVDTRLLRNQLETLTAIGPRPLRDKAASERTVAHLQTILESYGYEVSREEFAVGGYTGINLFATLQGGDRADEFIELSAHYDTVPGSPGADDNSSGVVGVLEAARVLADVPLRRSIRFCLFGAEEIGLLGSRHHVEQLEKLPGKTLGLLNFEMIGYTSTEPESQATPIRIPLLVNPPRTGDFICVVGNVSSGGVGNRFERAARRYVPELKIFSLNRIGGFLGDAARSDHFPYWNAGRRAVMITDTANFRNPHYHRESDTIDEIDFDFLTNVVPAGVATLVEWAEPQSE